MSTDSRLLGRGPRWLRRASFRHLLTVTLALVAGTIVLGVAAKATGSGLACQANWPQCDTGPFNLFPASLPSFYEWIHRFVAMFAGFAILGSGAVAWLSSSVDRRVAPLVLVGTVLTPVQVYLGRETVFEYEMAILSLHFWTAILIFSLFAVATVLAWKGSLSRRGMKAGLFTALATLPAHIALSPTDLGVVSSYTPTVQLLQYAVTLALILSVILVSMTGRWWFESRMLAVVLGAVGVLTLGVAYLGRRSVMAFSPMLDSMYIGSAVLLAVALVATLRLTSALEPEGEIKGSV
ncbi:cytochrome oxidase assembly protein [Haladaptatus sp. F3-133]|uniref:Cytochrome oxidase assembly protein n=1 Tax=Halorutilus salinus TaxID=2487751 RepID=A0A9Q4C1B5_9EURY|nr:cytochrome oxidase assembly protein [Halorutilus salinus]MCX2818100.1 cytochrome oxidase assembly protein [Halorutilus salinus]